VITIFSQFGEPTYINLMRDKETGKSRGFAFLKYEDQRSTDLAVDNLGGAVIKGRTLRVDHTRYKKRDDEPDEGHDLTAAAKQVEEDTDDRRKRRRTSESGSEEERPMIREEIELAKLMQDQDDEDPMKAFLIQEKKEEVSLALARLKDVKKSEKPQKHRHRHHKSRRGKEEDIDVGRRSQPRKEGRERRRSRSRDISPVDNGTGQNRRRHSQDRHDSNVRRRRDSRDRGDRERGGDGRSDRKRSPRRDSHDRGNHDDYTHRRRHNSRPES
jgi:RNA-binding motif X-linked protein 2